MSTSGQWTPVRGLIVWVAVAALATGGVGAAAGAEGAGGDAAPEVRLRGAVVRSGARSTARWSPRWISRPGKGRFD